MSSSSGAANDSTDGLTRECEMFTRYLVGTEPNRYVVQSYIDAHCAPALARTAEGIDRALLSVARMHPLGAALADSYAGLFSRSGLLRTKAVLAFGILESAAPYQSTLDRVPRGGMLRLASLGITGGLSAVCAVVIFGPLHLFLGRGADA